MASSNSVRSTTSLPLRAARRAASLTRLARSAPTKPGVVAAHDRADPSRLSQRIQLVDEDEARGLLLGLRKAIADARGPHADEHLDEVRATQAEERYAGLSRDRLGQQRFPGAGRADDEH